MDAGSREVRGPDGLTWGVRRAWLPRYRGVRDLVGDWLDGREDRWWYAPLRWFAVGRSRDRVVDTSDLVNLPSGPWPDFSVAPDGQALARALDVDLPDIGDPSPGGVGDASFDVGGGSDLAGDPGTASAATPDLSIGGGGDVGTGLDVGGGTPLDAVLQMNAAGGGGGQGLPDVGGGGFGAGDVGDGDALPFVVVAGIVAIGVLAAALVLWFVLVPVLLVVMDGTVLVLVVLLAGLVRLLFRRPWDVVATHTKEDGTRLVRRWEIRGFRRAGRVRDDVARALETGTDPDLAVARVVVREPRDDDPAGTARSLHEIQGG